MAHTQHDTDPAAAGRGLDLTDAHVVADLFDSAADAGASAEHRRGASVHLPRHGRLLLSGDLHAHTPNFSRLVQLSNLARGPGHHLVLQELIHSPTRVNGRDMSYRMLARAAALKCAYPNQVHLLLGNHELSQAGSHAILKDGVSVVEAYDEGLDFVFDEHAEHVRQSMRRFIGSMLLAVRCANGVFVSHSLPSQRAMGSFDPGVVDRVPSAEDLEPGGSAYAMVWGRNQTQEMVERLGEAWGATLFICGHQPTDQGYEILTRARLILSSDHDSGMALPLDLKRQYDMDALIEGLVPLNTVGA